MLDAPATHRILTTAGTFLTTAPSWQDTASVWSELDARNAIRTEVGLVRFNPAHVIAVVEVSP